MKAIHGPDEQAADRTPVARPHQPNAAEGTGTFRPAVVHPGDPRLAHGGGDTTGLMALQRSAGNAAVAALVGDRPAVQRRVGIEEMETSVDAADVASPAQSGAPETASPAQADAAPAAGGGAVTSDGATTTINGAHITLAAPMTEAAGVLRADTIIADNVVAATYSPGAGNVW